MEDSFPKKIDIDCTSNVQFEVIPPDVADIPLPEDVSEIPLPSPGCTGNTNISSKTPEECINDSSDGILTISEDVLVERDEKQDQTISEEQNSVLQTDLGQVSYANQSSYEESNEFNTSCKDGIPLLETMEDKSPLENISNNDEITSHEIKSYIKNESDKTHLNIETCNIANDSLEIINKGNITIPIEMQNTESVTSQEETNIAENTVSQTGTIKNKNYSQDVNLMKIENVSQEVKPIIIKDTETEIENTTSHIEITNAQNIIHQVKSTIPDNITDNDKLIVMGNVNAEETAASSATESTTPVELSNNEDRQIMTSNIDNSNTDILMNEEYKDDHTLNASSSHIKTQEPLVEFVVAIDNNSESESNPQIMPQIIELISDQEAIDKNEHNMQDDNSKNKQCGEKINEQKYVDFGVHDDKLPNIIQEAMVKDDTTTMATEFDEKVNPENIERDVERLDISEGDRLEISDDNIDKHQINEGNIHYVVEQNEKDITISKTNLIDYIQTHDPSMEEDESNVQYVVTNDNEQSVESNNLEYTSENTNASVLSEGVQYIVSKTSGSGHNQQDYVQYVVSENPVNKLPDFQTVAGTEHENQSEYIQYVVSEGSNQDNIVQYVVTSASNEKNIQGDDSESFVSYIVSESADEKDISTENSATAEMTYEVIEESSQDHSDVVIEEMEVENNANDQNEDIEIYVIEDDNMQVIEVHVEEPSLKKSKSDDTVLDENKIESSNRKRVPIGNYIEVVDSKGDTTAKLPCHVLGRNLKNPEADVLSNGRNPPKVRPGVKVPPLSLTSCIVTTEEISEEIDKKLKADVPIYDKPKVGDILFKHKITKRLAEKLCTSSPTSLNNPKSIQNQPRSSPNTRSAKKNILTKAKPKLDNADLLAILEGDEDSDWADMKQVEKDQAPPILQAIEKNIISGHSGKSPPPVLEAQSNTRNMQSSRGPLKLDSEEKRRLAQHQLMNLPHVPNICSSRPRGRPKLTDYNPLKHTLLKNAGMAVYTTPRSKDPPKTYSNRRATDMIKNLVSDWDEESRDEPKTSSVPTTKPSEQTVAQENIKNDITPEEKSTPKSLSTVSVTETRSMGKSSITATTSVSNSNSKATPTKVPTSTSKRKSSPIANSPQIGVVPNKMARVIKKKIIWDPDNPTTSVNVTPPQKNLRRDVSRTPMEISSNVTKKVTEGTIKKTAISSTASRKQLEKQVDTEEKNTEINEYELHKESEDDKLEENDKEVETKKTKVLRKLPHKDMFHNRSIDQKPTSSLGKDIPLLKKKKKLTEIDRLLSDEGAVNMIYSVERSHNNVEVPEIVTKPNKRLLISLEKERRNLLSKANIIKQAVLRHSSTTGIPSRNKKPLRFKKSTIGMRKGSMRKKIVPQSPMHEETPEYSFTSVNESRIIRRHSSSSYSSSCTSPRRLSVDLDSKSAQTNEEQIKEVIPDSELSKPLKKRQKGGVPIYSRPAENEKTYKGKTKAASSEQTSNVAEENKSDFVDEEKVNKTMNTRSNKKLNNSAEIDKDVVEKISSKSEVTPKDNTELHPEAPTVIAEQENSTEESPKAPVISKKLNKSPTIESDSSKEIKTYKEISIRKHENLVQIIMTPTSTKFKNSLNMQILHELKEVILDLSKDSSCHVVLLTSSGSFFCQGIDYSNLLENSTEKRQHIVQETVQSLIDLIRVLAEFPKTLVAGVHGAAIGFGVTMLPLFDLVLASDKATFSVPATKYGYIPEGTSLMPCYRLLSQAVVNELILACRELTASEALQYGLITRVLWPDKFQAELIPTIKAIMNHSVQAMTVTKAMLRKHLLNGLEEALENEKKQLTEMWMSSECQKSFQTALDGGLWK